MFQKLPLIIRKYDKGLQVDKRSQTDTNVTTWQSSEATKCSYDKAVSYRTIGFWLLMVGRPACKYQGSIGTAKAEAVGYSILQVIDFT